MLGQTPGTVTYLGVLTRQLQYVHVASSWYMQVSILISVTAIIAKKDGKKDF
jgi:hypothetical protein